jgi:hypothetical protein
MLEDLANEMNGMMLTVNDENQEINKEVAKKAMEEAINMFVPKENDDK